MDFFPPQSTSGGSTAWADITGKPSAVTSLTGTNTGDQTSIAGITGTKAQFNTAASDGDFLFVGDVSPLLGWFI